MKNALVFSVLLLACLSINAQTTALSSFEVNTQCIALANQNPFSHPDTLAAELADLPDNTPYNVNIIVSVEHASANDSLYITITNSQSQSVYSAGNTISGWKLLGADRTEGSSIYLTIDVGPFDYLKHFSAIAILRPSGGAESTLSYTKAY